MSKFVSVILVVLAATLAPSMAFAYVGPGAGLSAVGSLLSLLAALGLAVLGFIWYPIRRLLRSFQRKKVEPGE